MDKLITQVNRSTCNVDNNATIPGNEHHSGCHQLCAQTPDWDDISKHTINVLS